MKIKFIDCEGPTVFDSRDLGVRPMGGTEATLIRVAEGLAMRGHVISVCQPKRTTEFIAPSGVRYLGYDHRIPNSENERWDLVVSLRSFKILKRIREAYPDAVVVLWAHCFPGSGWKRIGGILEKCDVHLLAVSAALGSRLVTLAVEAIGYRAAMARVHVVYNPVSDSLRPDPAVITDPDKLVFFSSPHKGLAEVLFHFDRIRSDHPELKLHVADPGYWKGPKAELPEGVVSLGPLPHREVLRHVQEAWCVFYPQSSFEETFGLVFAEANALGTPVLAHPFPAAMEVLRPAAAQTVDCRSHPAVELKMRKWRASGTPGVHLASQFRLASVLEQWESLATGLVRDFRPSPISLRRKTSS